jgi:uncharacterized cupin superfamily protein
MIRYPSVASLNSVDAKKAGFDPTVPPQKIACHMDFENSTVIAGIIELEIEEYAFRAVELLEHATVLEGRVLVCDGQGNSVWYGPGDSYLLRPGESVSLRVEGSRVRISFCRVRVPSESTGEPPQAESPVPCPSK